MSTNGQRDGDSVGRLRRRDGGWIMTTLAFVRPGMAIRMTSSSDSASEELCNTQIFTRTSDTVGALIPIE